MDSITQAVLGAVIGELTLGRKLGWRAALWGAWLGTVPDLDVFFIGHLDEIARFHAHRGLSHSIFLLTLMAPLWALLISQLHKKSHRVTLRRATLMAWLALITHTLIDCFTIYGVEILQPFSHWRFTLSNLYVIDPLFTLPLGIGLIAARYYQRHKPERGQKLCWLGVGAASVYVLWSLAAQASIRERVQQELHAQDIAYQKVQIMPTPGNTLLWRTLVATDQHILIGYAGILDQDQQIKWKQLERNSHQLQHLSHTKAAQEMLWFADGFHVVQQHQGQTLVADLRFGEIERADGSIQPLSVWKIQDTADQRGHIHQLSRHFSRSEISPIANRFLTRIQGSEQNPSAPTCHSRRPALIQAAPLHLASIRSANPQNELKLSGLLCTP